MNRSARFPPDGRTSALPTRQPPHVHGAFDVLSGFSRTVIVVSAFRRTADHPLTMERPGLFDVWRHRAVGLNAGIDNKWRSRDKLARERDDVEVVVEVGYFAAVSCLARPTRKTFAIVTDAANVNFRRISEEDVRARVQTLRPPLQLPAELRPSERSQEPPEPFERDLLNPLNSLNLLNRQVTSATVGHCSNLP
jgi:hypothetical protein